MHLFDASLGFLGGHGIVGGHIPARHRHGVRHQVPRHRPGGRLLLRRGGGQQRRLPRGAQHGGALEAARSSTSARTTATAWAPRSSAPAPSTTSPSAACSYDMANEVVDGQDVLGHARRDGAGGRARARRASTRRCSRSAPTASWATRCPTRSTATTAPRRRSRSSGSATRSRSGPQQLQSSDGLIDEDGGQGARRGGAWRRWRTPSSSPTQAPGPGRRRGRCVRGRATSDDERGGAAARHSVPVTRIGPDARHHLPRRAQPGAPRGDAARRPRLPHGRGGRRLPGRVQGEPRACSTSSAPMRVVDTPITELGFAGVGVGAAMVGPAAGHRVHDLELRAARDRPGRQLRGQDALHVRRPVRRARSSSAARTAPRCSSRAQHSQAFESWLRPHPGPQGRHARPRRPTPRACSRAPSATTIRWSSSRARCSTTPRARCPTGEHVVPLGKADVKREGERRHDRLPLEDGGRRAQGGRAARGRGGIDVEVVDLRTIRPLDTEAVLDVGEPRPTAASWSEEGWPFAGVGAQVVDTIQREASTSSTPRSSA